MTWSKLIGDRAMEIVSEYEKKNGRNPEFVHRKGVGYDIESKNDKEVRFIEVKGVSESWKTYTWQPLHHTEVASLKNNPDKFYLYIVYFKIEKDKRGEELLGKIIPTLFVIPGDELLSKFNIKEQAYNLSPISQRKLEVYKK